MRRLDVMLDNGEGEEQTTIQVDDRGAPPILFVSPYGRTDFDRYEREVDTQGFRYRLVANHIEDPPGWFVPE